ncbi:acyl-CoA thioesterase [Brevibacterium litoralis]|uniref:acyl-CoA thioesterase n=1 Tax=Brevibacterium litoralis TaxID=3138935 RepID=UPI0032EAF3E1
MSTTPDDLTGHVHPVEPRDDDVLFGHNDLEGSFLDLMDLETIDPNIFRANYVFEEPWALYGGQVAAQALLAAARTVEEPARLPHSLHGYFLRPGNASEPTIFQVHRDRDGRSYSARRVVALQNGKVIFNMSTSFTEGTDSPDLQESTAASRGPVRMGSESKLPRMFDFIGRTTDQDYDVEDYPVRFWGTCTADLGDDQLLHAVALTYMSDISSGVGAFNTEEWKSGSSLDHSMWFHRPVDMNAWNLVDFFPRSVARGRGLYTGDITDERGALVASVAQETLYRKHVKTLPK